MTFFEVHDVLAEDDAPPAKILLGKRALYLPEGPSWFWVIGDDQDELCSLDLEFDCELPPRSHWLSWELNEGASLRDILVVGDSQDLEECLLRSGIAPGQPFMVWARYTVVRLPATTDAPEDWETEVDWEVVRIEPWSPDRASQAWEAFYGRKRMIR